MAGLSDLLGKVIQSWNNIVLLGSGRVDKANSLPKEKDLATDYSSANLCALSHRLRLKQQPNQCYTDNFTEFY